MDVLFINCVRFNFLFMLMLLWCTICYLLQKFISFQNPFWNLSPRFVFLFVKAPFCCSYIYVNPSTMRNGDVMTMAYKFWVVPKQPLHEWMHVCARRHMILALSLSCCSFLHHISLWLGKVSWSLGTAFLPEKEVGGSNRQESLQDRQRSLTSVHKHLTLHQWLQSFAYLPKNKYFWLHCLSVFWVKLLQKIVLVGPYWFHTSFDLFL